MVDVLDLDDASLRCDPACEALPDRNPDALLDLFLDALRRTRDELAALLVEEEDCGRVRLERVPDARQELVEQLLDLSCVDAALVEVSPRRVELRPLVEEVVRSFAVERTEDVVVDIPQKVEASIDPSAFERILGNLITNALCYGLPPVRVRVAPSDRHLRVAVEDAGPGVAKEFIPFLFDRFRRSERSQELAKGTGLGLAIARAYARAHGGDLVYMPAKPQGARFELVLPLSHN